MKSKLQSTTVDQKFLASSRTAESADNRALALARGVARLYDAGISLIEESLKTKQFRLKIRMIMYLHGEAYAEVDPEAGMLRKYPVRIENSDYAPPEVGHLPVLLEEMCDYVNNNWDLRSSLHLAAYVLWRLLWIHPFYEGNGSVARTLSYVVLSVREGRIFPGQKTIPEQIALDRTEYYEALAASDAAWAIGKLDVSTLETLIAKMLDVQLAS
jgi:Fic family protein